MKVRIRAFRAVDEPESCKRFIDGHGKILASVGVEKVTSSNHEWVDNPAAFVLICESMDREKVYGGARIHVSGGSQPLPFVMATETMDESVLQLAQEYGALGTGEFCGLWNSLEVAGYGIGAVYLIRASVAIISQLSIKTCFALCSPYTASIARNYGFIKDNRVGHNGTFYYPRYDLLATLTLLEDSSILPGASEMERDKVLSLREAPVQNVHEINRGREVNIDYELKLDNIDHSLFTHHRKE